MMSSRKLFVVAVIGIALAITLGMWLGSATNPSVARQSLEYGATLGGDAALGESTWFFHREEGRQDAVPDETPQESEDTGGLTYY